MVISAAPTVEAYLAELPADRRATIEAVRSVVNRNLPDGYVEGMRWGMVVWEVPLERFPETYNGEPLGYIGLAAQKRHFALYLMAVYQDPRQEAMLREGFESAGLGLDLGKSCLRFRKLEDLPLDLIARVVASTPPADLIAMYRSSRPA